MKKVVVFLGLCILATASIFAQSVEVLSREVKGVETKKVSYETIENGISRTKYGHEFTNKNNFIVTVEVELWQAQRETKKMIIPAKIVQTTSFVLKEGEKYVWESDDSYDWYSCYVKFRTFMLPY